LIELFGPEFLIAAKPIVGLAHWFRAQATTDDATILLAANETGIRKYIEMLHDGRQRHRERLRELTHGKAVFVAQPGKQCPPGRIGQRRKCSVKVWSLIVNHLVKYKSACILVKPGPTLFIFR